MSRSERVTFNVTGEFITRQARSFWAEEDEPEKALDLLRCLDGISEQQILDILEGRAKLTGCSNDPNGVQLEPDNTSGPQTATLTSVIRRLKEERNEAKDLSADLTQMMVGETVALASPTGLREVPFRKTKQGRHRLRVLQDPYDWDMNDPPVWRQLSRNPDLALRQLATPTPPPSPRRQLEPDDKITSATGWLSPDGKFYGCSYGQHNFIASLLDLDPSTMDESGWIRATTSGEEQHFFLRDYDKGPTAIQLKLVEAYCTERKIEVPYLFRQEATK